MNAAKRHISKQDWIDEIRRLSKIEGRPIGREACVQKTGWKNSWWQLYWNKWSDAQIEAGFTPNKMNAPYPEEFILESLAKLSVKLGHFPTKIEIKREARENQGFPSHNVFDRLGD